METPPVSRRPIVGMLLLLCVILVPGVWYIYQQGAVRWEELTGMTGVPAFALFLLLGFAAPIVLFGAVRFGSYRLVRACSLKTVWPVAVLIFLIAHLTGELRILLQSDPPLLRLIWMVGSVGINLGVVIGALEGAHAVWTRNNQ